jgi:hypothetical protein
MKKDRDDDLAAELNAHLAAHIDDNIRAGMAPDEARRSALLKLGGTMQTTERVRDAGSTQWLDDARLDLRHTFGSLRRAPGFALAAVAVIALGIAATTAAFTVLDHVLLRPLPFPQADRPCDLSIDPLRGLTGSALPPNFVLGARIRASAAATVSLGTPTSWQRRARHDTAAAGRRVSRCSASSLVGPATATDIRDLPGRRPPRL